MAPEYERQGVFDFEALPRELRNNIYKEYYAEVTDDPVKLTLYTRPDNSFRRTSHLIFKESEEYYEEATRKFKVARGEFLQKLFNDADLVIEDVREDILQSTVGGDDVDEEVCEHYEICKDNGFYCASEDHRDCIRCGRWLALALFYDTHPECTPPRLFEKGISGILTPFGKFIDNNTPPPKEWCRYPPLGQAHEFGEVWWRFELERQSFQVQARELRAHLEAQKQLPGVAGDGPLGLSWGEIWKRSWISDVQMLLDFNRIFVLNGFKSEGWEWEFGPYLAECDVFNWSEGKKAWKTQMLKEVTRMTGIKGALL